MRRCDTGGLDEDKCRQVAHCADRRSTRPHVKKSIPCQASASTHAHLNPCRQQCLLASTRHLLASTRRYRCFSDRSDSSRGGDRPVVFGRGSGVSDVESACPGRVASAAAASACRGTCARHHTQATVRRRAGALRVLAFILQAGLPIVSRGVWTAP